MSPAGAPQPARQATDQRRAQWAWDLVKGGVDKDYCGLVKAVPTLIMGNGLMQTVAFLGTKSKPEHKAVLEQLLKGLALTPSAPQAIEKMLTMSAAQYRETTEEALARLRWLRHFADVMKKG